MIPVSRLIASVRYALKDMQGATFSDHEIVEALNVASRLLFERLGARFVWPALKRTVLVVDHGRGMLPLDFHNIRKLSMDGGELRPVTGRPAEGQYRIAGDELYGPDGGYGLEYWYIPAPVRDHDDALDAPLALSPWIERMTVGIVTGDATKADETAAACCHDLAGGEWSGLSDMGPVQVWGGRA